jgi:hypothetical protein
MRKTAFKVFHTSILLALILGLFLSSSSLLAQQEDSTKEKEVVVQDNSSSFNDSVQFDDMEPVFYEAAKESKTAAPAKESSGGIFLYVGIAVVLVIVLIVLKKVSKKKS